MTPLILKRVVWAGANLTSFSHASTALQVLVDVDLSPKQVRRITEQVGQDRLAERRQQVEALQQKPLRERTASPVKVQPADLGVVMPDGGRYQRRDHFQEPGYNGSHWKEDKVGLVLHMQSEVHQVDPHPDFPEWLAAADAVREIAALGTIAPENPQAGEPSAGSPAEHQEASSGWSEFAPELLSREVIASSDCGDLFGWHLEQAAWRGGVVDASRGAFVADGAPVNWTIYRKHFSQLTGILDLMHALSYAWKAAGALNDREAYLRCATRIWQGRVDEVIAEFQAWLKEPASPERDLDEDAREAMQRALVYYENHRQWMNYPRYRREGLPLTSSHIESTIKQVNQRMKESEKFFGKETGESLLQLRADSLSDSRPLNQFWSRWFRSQTGANTYRKLPA